jgi:hypothetical protein
VISCIQVVGLTTDSDVSWKGSESLIDPSGPDCIEGGTPMTVSSHLSQLRQKHEALSRKIEDEQQRPGSDDLQINAMKRQKLLLKEEITRLSTQQ